MSLCRFVLTAAFSLVVGQGAIASGIVALGVQEALMASDAAKSFRASLLLETAAAEKHVNELEQQVVNLQRRVEGAGQDAEESKRAQLQLEKVYREFQLQAQSLQQIRAEREALFLSDMRPKLDSVIRQLIDEQGISVILNREATIYMEAGIDITPEVVKRLNAL